jgi:hypothetical protein
VRTQVLRVVEESEQRIFRVLELLQMGEKAARLHGVGKMRRSLLAPPRERGRRRQPVEAVVDLDRIEMERIVRKPARQGQIGGIKVAAPVRVQLSRTADSDGAAVAHKSRAP